MIAGQRVGRVPIAAHDLERLELVDPVAERRIGHAHLSALGGPFRHEQDAVGLLHRIHERVEQDGVDDAEHRHVGANVERQRQHRDNP